MADKKKLVVIDGKSVFYRGYYGMPNLSTREGKPTGGVYGFAVLALQILKKLSPDYVVVAWDKSKTNLRARRKLYEGYKANRKPMPQDLREQVPLIRELLKGFNWPLLECDDFEADDIMATLTRQAAKHDIKTVLVTSDLDLLQAVDGNSDVYLLKRGLTDVVEMTPTKFMEEYGVTPEQFIDIKALKGDSSDNVPGVAGVGEKTAKELVKEFGTLEGIYKNLGKIPEKLRAKLEADRDMAFLSHQLLEIRFDAPIKLDLKHADVAKANPKQVAQLFHDLEFRRLLDELPAQMKESARQVEAKVRASRAKLEVSNLDVVQAEHLDGSTIKLMGLDKAPELVFYTLAADRSQVVDMDIRGFLVSGSPKQAAFIDCSGLDESAIGLKLAPLLKNPKGLVGYDLKSDLHALLKVGVEPSKVAFDVQVVSFLLNSLQKARSLSELSKEQLNTELAELGDMDLESLKQAGPQIISAIWQLKDQQHKQLSKISKLSKLATDIEFPSIPVIAQMEYRGIQLDSQYLKKMSQDFAKQIETIQGLIHKEAKEDFNISSPIQLQKVLFETLQLPTQGIKKTQGGYSTAVTELDKLRGLHPIINLISEYRELTKLKSTYVDALPKQVDAAGKLHTTYNLTVAPTGRLSSENPNLQNIPIRSEVGREIRKAFVAGKGNVLVGADYSQFELRLAAVLAGDKTMIHAFNKGIDIHAMTAAEVYDLDDIEMVTKNQRRDAKAVNFGVLYGQGAHGLSVGTGMSHQKAQEFINRYFELRKDLLKYIESVKKQAHDKGYVETLFGRRRPTPDVKSSNFMVRAGAERAAVNMPIQGTAADLMKMAMNKIEQELDDDCHMLLQIHDSILLEVPKTKSNRVAKLVKDTMENVHKLPVKLAVDVSVGSNWSEL